MHVPMALMANPAFMVKFYPFWSKEVLGPSKVRRQLAVVDQGMAETNEPQGVHTVGQKQERQRVDTCMQQSNPELSVLVASHPIGLQEEVTNKVTNDLVGCD